MSETRRVYDRYASVRQAFRFFLLLVISWCVMTVTHETGHLIGGYLSGAKLQAADLAPWRMPYSLFQPNPHPLITLWSGPLFGVLFPLALAQVLKRSWADFVAHFCVLANGIYLTTAWITGDRLLDTAKLLEHGASKTALAAFCATTLTIGYARFRKDCIQALRSDIPAPTTHD